MKEWSFGYVVQQKMKVKRRRRQKVQGRKGDLPLRLEELKDPRHTNLELWH